MFDDVTMERVGRSAELVGAIQRPPGSGSWGWQDHHCSLLRCEWEWKSSIVLFQVRLNFDQSIDDRSAMGSVCCARM